MHRPLSRWVSEVAFHADGTGSWDPGAEPNSGDRRSDARRGPRFEAGWRRLRIRMDEAGGGIGALGLARDSAVPRRREAVVELTDAGVPMPVSEAAVAVVERWEGSWPGVRAEPGDLAVLTAESLALRWALLGRLSGEAADPPAELFHALPWERVERLSADLVRAIDAGGGISDAWSLHWLTPSGSRFGSALDQMNHRLRGSGPDGLADHGARALCEDLAGADLARFPVAARAALAGLTRRLADLDPSLREAALGVTGRLLQGAGATSGPVETRMPVVEPVRPVTDVDVVRIVADWLDDLPAAGPGVRTAEIGGVRMSLTVTARGDDEGEVTLEVSPPVDGLRIQVRPEGRRDAVTYLDRLTAGRMDLELRVPPPYGLRRAKGRRSGRRREAFDAYTSEREPLEVAVAGDDAQPRAERRLVVPGPVELQVRAYETRGGELVVSASAGSRDAAGRWLELVLLDLRDGIPQVCVIPLTWVRRKAEGLLRVGDWSDRLVIAVNPDLIDDPALLDLEAVRWSAEHAGDERTERPLRAILESGGGAP